MATRTLVAPLILAALTTLAACNSGKAANVPTVSGTRASTIVVSSIGSQNLASFPATATGSVAPTYDVSGGSTGIDAVYNIFVDTANSTLWASDALDGAVTEYPLTANGDQTPTLTLGPGGSTTLDNPAGIVVKSDGTIVVADNARGTVDVFAPGASGTAVAPEQQITGLSDPEGLVLDSSGDIWVATFGGVFEFAPSASGAASPMASITSVAYPAGLAIDAHGNIWVSGCTDDASTAYIDEFPRGSNGAATPTRTIVGANTNQYCPYSLAVDGAGYVYEVDRYTSVNVFAPGASGDVAPVQTIPENGTTTLNGPSGLGIY